MLKQLFIRFKKTKLFKNIQKTIPYRAARKVYRFFRKRFRAIYKFLMLRKQTR